MHYGFSVLFVVTFSSPHFIPLIDIGVEIGEKREKKAEKQQKIFLTLDFDNSNLSNQGYFVFCWFFCSPPFVGHCPKRVLPVSTCHFLATHCLFCRKQRVVLLETTCCFVENDVLFCWKRRVVSRIRLKEKKRTRGEWRMKIGEKEHWSRKMNLWKYL